MAPHGQFTPTENRITFDIDRNIDINSKALLDMIFENDTVSVASKREDCGSPSRWHIYLETIQPGED